MNNTVIPNSLYIYTLIHCMKTIMHPVLKQLQTDEYIQIQVLSWLKIFSYFSLY